MHAQSAGVSRWTQRFVVAGASALVAYFAAVLLAAPRRVTVFLGLFGFVCLTVFGMGYLLLPPYLGRTVADHRFAGAHFALAVGGLGLLVAGFGVDAPPVVARAGGVLWAAGVAVFVAALGATALGAVRDAERGAGGLPGRPESPRVAAAAIPVALAYLVAGTVGLLAAVGVPVPVDAPVLAATHYYAVGFAALLVFALGARLLPGFFGVSPPVSLQWLVLVAGAAAPALLAEQLWVDAWFRVGASLEVTAFGGYCAGVLHVVRASPREHVGRYGVVLGAVSGLAAVAAGASAAFGVAVARALTAHVALVLGGFFPLTVVGYALLFFPVTNRQFAGATTRTAVATLALLATGVGLQVLALWTTPVVGRAGAALSVCGAATYWYVLVRRFSPG